MIELEHWINYIMCAYLQLKEKTTTTRYRHTPMLLHTKKSIGTRLHVRTTLYKKTHKSWQDMVLIARQPIVKCNTWQSSTQQNDKDTHTHTHTHTGTHAHTRARARHFDNHAYTQTHVQVGSLFEIRRTYAGAFQCTWANPYAKATSFHSCMRSSTIWSKWKKSPYITPFWLNNEWMNERGIYIALSETQSALQVNL